MRIAKNGMLALLVFIGDLSVGQGNSIDARCVALLTSSPHKDFLAERLSDLPEIKPLITRMAASGLRKAGSRDAGGETQVGVRCYWQGYAHQIPSTLAAN